MAEPSTVYSLNVVKDLADDELYQKLYENWGITDKKIDVWGELSMNEAGNWAGVRNAKTLSGNQTIEYPLSGSNELQSGVFLNPAIAKALLGDNKKVLVACQLVLASSRQRAIKNNPFLLAVDENTVEQLTDLTSVLSESERQDIVADSENTLIRKAVYELEVQKTKEQIELEVSSLKQLLQSTKTQTDQEIKQLEEAEGLSQQKVTDLEDVLKRLALEYEQLSEDKENVSQSIAVSKAELETIEEQYRKVEGSMVKKIEKLTNFIQEKAAFLKAFEFIDDDEFNSFVSNITKVRRAFRILCQPKLLNI